jgi:hypothetical protein
MEQPFAALSVRIHLSEKLELLINVRWTGLRYGGGKHLWVLTAEEFTTIWQESQSYLFRSQNSLTAHDRSSLHM